MKVVKGINISLILITRTVIYYVKYYSLYERIKSHTLSFQRSTKATLRRFEQGTIQWFLQTF